MVLQVSSIFHSPPELNQGPTKIRDGKRNKWDKLPYKVTYCSHALTRITNLTG